MSVSSSSSSSQDGDGRGADGADGGRRLPGHVLQLPRLAERGHHLCWLGPEEGRTGGRGARREGRVLSSSVLAGTGRREDRWERGGERGAGIVIICAGWDRKKGGQVGEGRGERGGYCHHLCWLGPEEGRTGGRGAGREGRVLSSSVLAGTGRREDRWERGAERGAGIVIICAGWDRKKGGERGAGIVIICAGWDRKKGGQVGGGRGQRGGYCHHLCWLGPEEGRTGGRGAGREGRILLSSVLVGTGRGVGREGRILSSSVLAGTGRREDRWERGGEGRMGAAMERGGYCHHLRPQGPYNPGLEQPRAMAVGATANQGCNCEGRRNG